MPATPSPDSSSPQDNLPAEAPAGQHQMLALFRERLLAGNYDALIGKGLRRSLRSAAADAGLETEIGALRLALVRLLTEEHDPARLAAGVSRVAGVAVQAARLRNSPNVDLEQIRALMLRELEAIEHEFALAAGQPKERNHDAE